MGSQVVRRCGLGEVSAVIDSPDLQKEHWSPSDPEVE